jgi:hypothetical protein
MLAAGTQGANTSIEKRHSASPLVTQCTRSCCPENLGRININVLQVGFGCVGTSFDFILGAIQQNR